MGDIGDLFLSYITLILKYSKHVLLLKNFHLSCSLILHVNL